MQTRPGDRSPDEIRRWLAMAEEEVRKTARGIELAQEQHAEAKRKVAIFQALLARAMNTQIPPTAEVRSPMRSMVQQHAATILRERGQPMSIGDIHAEFIRRKFPLPGRGTATNLIPHLRASPGFVRPRHGTYALAEWSDDTTPSFTSESAEGEPGSDS